MDIVNPTQQQQQRSQRLEKNAYSTTITVVQQDTPISEGGVLDEARKLRENREALEEEQMLQQELEQLGSSSDSKPALLGDDKSWTAFLRTAKEPDPQLYGIFDENNSNALTLNTTTTSSSRGGAYASDDDGLIVLHPSVPLMGISSGPSSQLVVHGVASVRAPVSHLPDHLAVSPYHCESICHGRRAATTSCKTTQHCINVPIDNIAWLASRIHSLPPQSQRHLYRFMWGIAPNVVAVDRQGALFADIRKLTWNQFDEVTKYILTIDPMEESSLQYEGKRDFIFRRLQILSRSTRHRVMQYIESVEPKAVVTMQSIDTGKLTTKELIGLGRFMEKVEVESSGLDLTSTEATRPPNLKALPLNLRLLYDSLHHIWKQKVHFYLRDNAPNGLIIDKRVDTREISVETSDGIVAFIDSMAESY
jgi:hypothetical protein